MANFKQNTFNKAALIIALILMSIIPLRAHAVIFLLPIIASKSDDDSSNADKAMKSSDTVNVLVENTAIAELNEGTAYAYFKTDGAAVGIHPVHGRIDGNWKVDNVGKTCITWLYPNGSITNCATVTDLGNGKYQFGDRKFSVSMGDMKNLN
jgi:hypothetical protein